MSEGTHGFLLVTVWVNECSKWMQWMKKGRKEGRKEEWKEGRKEGSKDEWKDGWLKE